MRLLFISNLYPPFELGGYGQWCHEIASQLRLRKHHVEILTSNFRSHDLTKREEGVHRLLHLQADMHHYEPLRFFQRFQKEEAENLATLQKIVDTFKPDLILVWGMWNLSPNVPFWAEKMLPRRVAYVISSYWPAEQTIHEQYWQTPANRTVGKWAKRPLRFLAQRQFQKVNYPPVLRFEHVRCCSQYVRDTLVQQHKIPVTADVLLAGIDPTPFKKQYLQKLTQSTQPLRLLYFGRLIADKGVHTIIEALAQLKAQTFDRGIRLTILGSGHSEYEAYLQNLVATHDLEDQITFVGQVSTAEIPDWLAQHDVFIFSSIWPEPFGRTILEAMAAGLIVIGSDVGGSREIFHNYSETLLFPAGDARQLAQRIELVCNDNELRSRLILRGHEVVETLFAMEQSIDRFEHWFETIVDAADLTHTDKQKPGYICHESHKPVLSRIEIFQELK